MKKILHKIRIFKNTAFFATLGLLALIGCLWFCRPTESQVEKRKLTEFPKISAAGVLNGSFARGIDTWYADTYPLREPMIQGWAAFQTLYGNRTNQFLYQGETGDPIPSDPPPSLPPATDPSVTTAPPAPTDTQATEPTYEDGTITTPGEKTGSLYIVGDQAFAIYYFVQSAADNYAAMLNHTYEVLGDKTNIYSIIAPIDSGVLLDKRLQDELRASSQEDTIQYIYARVNDGIHKVDVFTNLKKHNAEYVYFRTDHHWTARGAYYAYESLIQAMGGTPHTLDQFERREYPGFLGSHYSASQAQALKNNPDVVEAFVPMGTNRMTMYTRDGEELAWNIVNDVSDYGQSTKYSCFAGADQPLAYAHNPQITDGSACVVIKDSYGNALIPFLIDHYEYVYWLDFRYYQGTLTDLVAEKHIQDVIYCINIYNSTEQIMVDYMRKLVP